MKIEKFYLLLALITGILCVPALGDIQMLKSGKHQRIERPWGLLAHLDTIDFFDMTILCPDSNKDVEFWENLYDKVIARFPECIKMQPSLRSWRGINYKIRIEILGFEGSPNHLARVQSSLTWFVIPNASRGAMVLADVWATAPAMKVVSIQNLHEAVSGMVMEQVEEFISDYQKAKQAHPQLRPFDGNDANSAVVPAIKKSSQQPIKKAIAKYNYVASKNSKVFHKPECSSAKRISPENLVGYNSRDEAIRAGKRPCKICKP